MQSEKSTETANKIRILEERITQKLNPNLQKAVEHRRVLKAQLQDYLHLERNLKVLQHQVRTFAFRDVYDAAWAVAAFAAQENTFTRFSSVHCTLAAACKRS